MKNLYPWYKTIMTLLFALFVASLSYAQQERPGNPIGGIIVKGGKNPGGNMLLNLSGGISTPGKDFKEMNHHENGFSFNANLYVPVFELTEQSTLGFNTGFGMLGFKNEKPSIATTGYQISGQSAKPELSYFDDTKNNRNGFTAEGGVQANLSFDKITVSPILNLGYIRIKVSSQSVTQTSSVNGQNYTSEIYNRKMDDIENFMFIPKLRISYFPGKVGFFAEASYLTGGKANTTASMFQPNGAPNQEGFYSIDQIKTGKTVSQTSSSTVSSFAILIGVSIPLGKSISEKGVKRSERLSMTPTTTKQTQGSTFGEKVASGLSSGGNAIGQGASLLGGAKGKVATGTSPYWASKKEFDSWKANSEIAQQINTAQNSGELQKIKTDFLNDLFVTKNSIAELKSELFKEAQASDDLKKRKISISKDGKSYFYLGNQDDLASVISIPSSAAAIAQQCTNCTISTCDGKTYTDCTCVNGFCMCLLCPVISTLTPLPEEKIINPGGKSISEQGVKRSEKLSVPSTTPKQTQGSTFGEKVASGIAVQGNTPDPSDSPQNIIYGGNPPPIMLCVKLFDKFRNEIPINGFVDMHQVYSISFLPCGGGNPNALVILPPGSSSVSNQTLVSQLIIKSDKSLAGKTIKLKKDIDITENVAPNYAVEHAFIKAGEYTFNDQNEISLNIMYGSTSEKLPRTYTGGRKNEPQGRSISEKGVSASTPPKKNKSK